MHERHSDPPCRAAIELDPEYARAVLIDPDNMSMRYNLACDLVISGGDFDLALELLGPVCARMGKERMEWLKSDPDFDAVREDERFRAMIAAAERRLAATG